MKKSFIKQLNLYFLCLLPVFFTGLVLAGCSTAVGVKENSPEERRFYGVKDFSGLELNPASSNFLNDFHLSNDYENAPEMLISKMEQIYRKNRDSAAVTALADVSWQLACRFRKDPDTGSRFLLGAAFYSWYYLQELDNPSELYDENRLWMIRICNQASTELFYYLKSLNMERNCNFALPLPGNDRQVFFEAPVFDLPLPPESVESFIPCAGYRICNLTHNARISGLGVPLIGKLKKDFQSSNGIMMPKLPISVTAVPEFSFADDFTQVHCRLRYLCPRTNEKISLKERKIPLAADFSTPIALAVNVPPEIDFLRRTFKVQEASDFSGLFLFEPYDDKRIPVVFVHGLMSDMRTWTQMLNTLLNDRKLRQKYQFLGFAYSSGNPIFVSAAELRAELTELRSKLIKQNRSTDAFDRMVLIGHSMGGLLCRLQTTGCTLRQAADILEIKDFDKMTGIIETEDLSQVKKTVNFSPLPFVERVIFIAVPHRGSEFASSWIGALGASLIELPLNLVRINVRIIDELFRHGTISMKSLGGNTGIENLRPDAPTLKLLNQLPMSPQVPYHSIIGNDEQSGIPGGTDGIVPYWSSHLDQAASELIVHSGHSAHRVPPAIQEVRQILLKHAEGSHK